METVSQKALKSLLKKNTFIYLSAALEKLIVTVAIRQAGRENLLNGNSVS